MVLCGFGYPYPNREMAGRENECPGPRTGALCEAIAAPDGGSITFKSERHRRPLPRRALGPDAPPVGGDDRLGNCQPQAAATGTRWL
jgi:hypothetical protein